MRVGFGYDVHRLQKGLPLTLGGIRVPHSKGPVAHSDGDVLIHAICDALLGAANLGDIGTHFPDTSAEFENIDSKILLHKTITLLNENNYEIVNIDSTICLQKPKVKEYIPSMQSTLSKVLRINENDLSIKATTTEKLGFVGTEEGISAYAITLIQIKK